MASKVPRATSDRGERGLEADRPHGRPGARVEAADEARGRPVARHRVVEARGEGHEGEEAPEHEEGHEGGEGAAAARAEERHAGLGGEGLGRAVLLDRDEVQEDGAHRRVEERDRAHPEGEGARQRAPRVADLARELRRLPPPAEREEREHEGAGERRDEGRRAGAPREEGDEVRGVARARGEAPRHQAEEESDLGDGEAVADAPWRGAPRGRWRRRSPRSRRGPRPSARGRAGPRRRRRRGPWRAPR